MESLYLYINQIHDYNQYIRIIYRNSLIKNKKEKKNKNITCDKSCLFNLSMNGADCFNKNAKKNKSLRKGINRTNLSMLDLISVLKGYKIKNEESIGYSTGAKRFMEYLEKKLDANKALKNEIINCEIDIEKFKKNIKYMEEFEKIDIEYIINNPNSVNRIFIKAISSIHTQIK